MINQTIMNQIGCDKYTEHRQELIAAFKEVRQQTLNLTSTLSAEDMQIQSMPDASPTKWHMAHTSWFFEAFILAKFQSGFSWHDPMYHKLYNSYYNALGEPFSRAKRGMITRPSVDEIRDYRENINARMTTLLTECRDAQFKEIAPLLVIGLNHEQQHQELILTDIKHALFQNPTYPAVFPHDGARETQPDQRWLAVEGGEVSIGYAGDGFCFDNELPRHRVLLDDFEISNRLITNAEWLEFMQDGGYEKPLLWLSDGWAWKNENQAKAPFYWVHEDDEWQAFSLAGLRSIKPNEPVTHINYYEADAYARWTGCRLPTEQEWEHAATLLSAKDADEVLCLSQGLSQGLRWEWTSSAYLPYPGFCPAIGNVGEYNGKFMINQMILRGASGATQCGHSRFSYRNFFGPSARWQFSGVRLVRLD